MGPAAGGAYLSALLLVALSGASVGTAVYVEAEGGVTLRQAFEIGALSGLVLLPFCAFAAWCARRWVRVAPAPALDGLLRQGPAAWPGLRWAAAVALATVVGVALSFAVSLALLPAVEDESALPLVGLSDVEVLLSNLQVLAEEAAFRLAILFPALALLGVRGADRAARPGWRVWTAIVAAAVLFGLAHMPVGEAIGADAAEYALFAVVQKGLVLGVLLGWLAWRWGIEAAFAAHYATNLVFLFLAAHSA